MKKRSNNSGFTLVELAIVMIIIGLLIGGILKGQELLISARVTSTISQTKNYAAAALTFKDTHNAWPGDMARANLLLPGCADAANFCGSGDGNGYVGRFDTTAFQANQAGVMTAPDVETSYFWKHLILSGLISDIRAISNPANPEWGQTHPANSLTGGGFTVFSSMTNREAGRVLSLRLQKQPTGASSAIWGNALDPMTAHKIDSKMDDGLPDAGNVRADFESTGCKTAGTYTVATDSEACIMYFQLY